MTNDPQSINRELRVLDIDPVLFAALLRDGAIRKVSVFPGAFEYPCVGSPDEPELVHYWIPGGSPAPWTAPARPAFWMPMGAAKTAIVCVGATAGLALTSILFAVSEDGSIRRRPRLPEILQAAVPVVLPETAEVAALEWLRGERDFFALLLAEYLHEAGFDLAFLCLDRRPPGIHHGLVDAFVSNCVEAGDALLVQVAPVLLDGGMSLPRLLAPFHGYGRIYALAGGLEIALQAARSSREPTTEGDPP